ncbi:hypothetical protein EIP86_003235 [Pleurotus ostreatoroseus]|nr:hypothetical protein EIP86_003235 [Pleurotus ostreatoroseus]
MLSRHVLRSIYPTRTAHRVVSAVPRRTYAVEFAKADKNPNHVTIVEVGPRDGLQNERRSIPQEVKIELISRLGHAGMPIIEAGSFVSPKWVPQMAGTADVIRGMERIPGRHYPVLVPNLKGLENLLEVLAQTPAAKDSPPPTDEIAIFTAATDSFCKANTNCTILESLDRLQPVVEKAKDNGLRVRGYVSVVIACPYSGEVDPDTVSRVTQALLDMGCYEVSLGDTTGNGTPATVRTMLEAVMKDVSPNLLAGHFHDTFGTAVANVMAALDMGIRTIDASVAGLGGCPYSPGATGNVATEDVLYALRDSQYTASGNLDAMVDVGDWISRKLERKNASRAATAILSRRQKDRQVDARLEI